ncbi:hypothetical protein KJ564_03270 [bacterium]|nr:hypothetical protein [bacterium]MBU1882341.1 hypothetical protein [bacterium]
MDRSYTPDRATSLRHFLSVIFKRKLVIISIALLTLIAGAMKLYSEPDEYQAQAKLLLERDPELEKALLLRISSTGRSGGASYTYTQESEIMSSRPVLESVILDLGLYGFDDTTVFLNAEEKGVAMQEAVYRLGSYITIAPSTDPNIIKVRFKSQTPGLCASVVNKLVDNYIAYRFKIFSDDQSLAFLERQIAETAGQLNELQHRRAEFQKDGTLYTPDREGDLLFTKLAEYENRADNVRLDRIAKEAKLTTLRSMLETGSYDNLAAIDMGTDNVHMKPLLDLRTQIKNLEYERDRLRERYTDDYVEVQSKTSEIESLTSRLKGEIDQIVSVLGSSILSLQNEESTLRRSAATIRDQIGQLSDKELELQKLSRGISEKEELYSLLLKQREEARLSKSKSEMIVRVKIISPAVVPIDPIQKNRMFKLFVVLFFGIFAGISLAFAIDFFDHSFSSAEDVQRYLELETLASIRSH